MPGMGDGERDLIAADLEAQGEPGFEELAAAVQMCDAGPETTNGDGSTDAGHCWVLMTEVLGIEPAGEGAESGGNIDAGDAA